MRVTRFALTSRLVNSGQCRRREKERRERGSLVRVAKDNEGVRVERRGEGVEPRGLINETYAAAADTKMHCKYGVPEKLLSPDEIYACPN